MENHTITVDELMQWCDTEELLFAKQTTPSSSKELKVNMRGEYVIYLNGEAKRRTVYVEDAVDCYNALIIK